MTREEVIDMAATEYTESNYSVLIDRRELHKSFMLGAKWADEHPISGEQIAAMKNEIKFLKRKLIECDKMYRELQNKNQWVTDRDPEIKGSISDAVLLLVDGMFYKVSRLERRKDGSEFWWGVDVVNGEEVDAWMPIPELKKGE